MKKAILLTILVLLSSSAFAQPGVAYQQAPNAFERFLNTPITKETLTTGAQRVGAVVLANKGKVALSTLAIGGVVWYNYLINHPEKMVEFFAVHPDLLDQFTAYVNIRLEHAQSQEEYNTFANVKQQLALDQNTNNAQTAVITNDPVYQQLESTVTQEVNSTIMAVEQSGRMPKCNINVVAQILEPVSIFNRNIDSKLPNIQNSPTNTLDVGTFKNLKSNYDSNMVAYGITPDHIPSYGALAVYFKAHGLAIPLKRNNSNLESNSSSIMIPTLLHQNGSRTFGGRNKTKNSNGDSTMIQDASNLLKATILDIATTSYLFYINPQYNVNVLDYIKNSMVLVERNKLLCMYDVK